MTIRTADAVLGHGSLRRARGRGQIEVFPGVVAAIAGHAAIGCYGIMGMAARGLRDGMATLLRREQMISCARRSASVTGEPSSLWCTAHPRAYTSSTSSPA